MVVFITFHFLSWEFEEAVERLLRAGTYSIVVEHLIEAIVVNCKMVFLLVVF